MMKKKISAALAAALAATLALGTACAEGVKIDGKIEAAQTRTLLAPYGGVVGNTSVRAGDALAAGDALFALSTQPVYADFDGTITGVFAQPGDSAASVQQRYGALAYIERDTLYTADCTTTGADSDNENKIVHVGERVYVRSSANSDRIGEARVTGVSGKSYTLEIVEEEDMRLGENVKVYRKENYASSSCIGTGKVSRVDPQAVTAEGHVLAVHVADGQSVRRGDLLFEIVPDALDGMAGGDGSVAMPEDGVLLTMIAQSGERVAKDAPLATYCPAGAARLVCAVDEEDLAGLAVGDVMRVTLDAYRDAPIRGTVEKIASASADGQATFDVTIALEANANARIGMSASAEK